jgi:hypothetical protein
MNTHERTVPATVGYLVLVVAAFSLMIEFFRWPTSRLGRPPSGTEILVYDVLPEVVAGYAIGLGAMALTRFVFPRANIKVLFVVVVACAALTAFLLLKLAAAIGPTNPRDLGAVASLFAVPVAIATWGVVSWHRQRREAR